MNICFATEVNYQNYINRIKLSSLGDFFKKNIHEYGIPYYISSNIPGGFDEYKKYDFVKVFDIEELRGNHTYSKNLELLPADPRGLYPAKYPWNIRRFIVEKAAKDGFDYVVYIEADNEIIPHVSGEEVVSLFKSNYEPNTFQTSAAIFRYANKAPADVFEHHDDYIKHFNVKFRPEQYDTVDGTVQVYSGKTNEDILRFISIWHNLSEFAYTSPFGYKNNAHGSLSFAIPMSGFALKEKPFPFYQNHRSEERY